MVIAEKPENITHKTYELVEAWRSAVERTKHARQELSSAECAENNSRNEMGRFLTPKDARAGERFQIWIGNAILDVSGNSTGDFSAQWRGGKEPSK